MGTNQSDGHDPAKPKALSVAEKRFVGKLRSDGEEFLSQDDRTKLEAALAKASSDHASGIADPSAFFLRLKRIEYTVESAKHLPEVFPTFVRTDLKRIGVADDAIDRLLAPLPGASEEKQRVVESAIIEQCINRWSDAITESKAQAQLQKWASLILGGSLLLFLLDGRLAIAIRNAFSQGWWSLYSAISTFVMLHAVILGMSGTLIALVYFGLGRIVPDRIDSRNIHWAILTRLVLGGWAGLIAFLIISLSIDPFHPGPSLNQSILFAGCFSAGFTDRYFVGAVESVKQMLTSLLPGAKSKTVAKKTTPAPKKVTTKSVP